MSGAEVVNLRRARKLKQRVEAESVAAANRLRHGRTIGERDAERLEADRLRRALDGAQRDRDGV